MPRRLGPQLILAGMLGTLLFACGTPDSDNAAIADGPTNTDQIVTSTSSVVPTSLRTSQETGIAVTTSILASKTPDLKETQAPTTSISDPDNNIAQSEASVKPVDGNPAANYTRLSLATQELERSFERSHPFQTLNRFCVPYQPVVEERTPGRVVVKRGDHLSRIADRYDVTIEELVRLNNIADPNLLFVGQELLVHAEVPTGLGPQPMGRGITEEVVTIVHLRTRLEELDRIGLGIETGDMVTMFQAFVDIINEECGGLHGRRLDLQLVEVSALGGAGVDLDTLRNAACLEATKSIPAVIVLTVSGLTGTASRCITVDQQTALVTNLQQPSSIVSDADGRLLIDAFTAEQALELMVTSANQAGLLDDRHIAVIAPDTPTQAESVEIGLTNTLRRLGHDPATHLIGCDGTVWCRTGLETAVSRMLEQGTDLVFPALNPVSLPELIIAMEATGVLKPMIIQSTFNQHGTDWAADLVLRYGGTEAARFYDGTTFVGHRDTGRHRLKGYSPPDFDEMCNAEYSRFTGSTRVNSLRRDNAIYDTVTQTCAMVRYVARALYDAGPNPTRRDVHEALASLGSVDTLGMLPGSFLPGKSSSPDLLQTLVYEYPCRHGPGYRSSGDTPGGCVLPTDNLVATR